MTAFRTPGRPFRAALAFLLGWGLCVCGAGAHPAYLTAAQVAVEPEGRFTVQFRFDLLAYVLNDSSARIGNEPMEALLAGPPEELAGMLDKAKARLGRGFQVFTDAGAGAVDAVSFPDATQVLAWQDQNHAMLPVVLPVGLSGHLPPGATTVACRFPAVLDQVILTVERPGEEPEAEAVDSGKISTALPVRLVAANERMSRPGSSFVGKPPIPSSKRSSSGLWLNIGSTQWLTTIVFSVLGLAALSGWWRQKRQRRQSSDVRPLS